jgi:hypothetical protein
MKRHGFDPFSFLFGAVFVTIGATFLFGASGTGHVRAVHVWPAVVVVVGAAIALWAIARVLRPQPVAVPLEPTAPLEPVESPLHDEGAAPDGATPSDPDSDPD